MQGNFVYSSAAAVTPNDSLDLLREPTQALLVTVTGDLSIVMESGGTINMVGVAANTLLPLRVARVRATGTTATVVALY